MKKAIKSIGIIAMVMVAMVIPAYAAEETAVMEWGSFLNEVWGGVQQAILSDPVTTVVGVFTAVIGGFSIGNNVSNKKTRKNIDLKAGYLDEKATKINNNAVDLLDNVTKAMTKMVDAVGQKVGDAVEAVQDLAENVGSLRRETAELKAEVRMNNVYWREMTKYAQLTELQKEQIQSIAERERDEILKEVEADDGNHEA